MSNADIALKNLVDAYARADREEKLAAKHKAEIKAELIASGLLEIEGTHAKITITESERVTLDPETVRGVVTPKQFLSIVSVSADKARKIMDEEVFKACVENITKVQTMRICAKVSA